MTAKLWAIFWRDLQTAASYRAAFLLQFAGPLFVITSFYFVGRLLRTASVPGLDRYGGDYFAFVLVGLVFTMHIGIALNTISTTIRRGQMLGTLEVVFTTQTNLATFLTGSALYAIVRSTVFMVVYLVLGAALFGVSFAGANVFAALFVLLLSMGVMLGLGVLAGSFIMAFKQGDPFTTALTTGAFLLSGVAYPVAVLPGWLQVFSAVFPHTYALEALRLTLLQGAPLSAVATDVGALVLFAAIILPASFVVFRYAVGRARMEGSLAQF